MNTPQVGDQPEQTDSDALLRLQKATSPVVGRATNYVSKKERENAYSTCFTHHHLHQNALTLNDLSKPASSLSIYLERSVQTDDDFLRGANLLLIKKNIFSFLEEMWGDQVLFVVACSKKNAGEWMELTSLYQTFTLAL